jgi:hypothetical protein
MLGIIFCVLIAASAVTARADSLAYTVTPEAGDFFYSFVLVNTGATGGTLFDLFLSLPLNINDVDTSTIGTPVGWGDPTGGLLFFGPDVNPSTASFIEWADDASGLFDLGIGGTLAGFSFVSTEDITAQITFALNDSATFSAATPVSSIPEPRLTLFIAGLWLTCWLAKKALEPHRGTARDKG